MLAYEDFVRAYNGVPKTQDAVKAALQNEHPCVQFARVRTSLGTQVMMVKNLKWFDGEDVYFQPHSGLPPQGGSPIAPEPEQKTAEAAEKAPSMDCEERPLPEEMEEPYLF